MATTYVAKVWHLTTRYWLRAALTIVASVLALLVLGALYQIIATKRDAQLYPPLGKMVNVNGYEMHINCVGEGSPTVIMDSGMGNSSLVWSNVQPEVAKFTRVCTYDRAGLG